MKSHQLSSAVLGVLAILQLVLAQGREGFLSLDCGLSANEPPYTESTTGLTFSSDAYFVEGGISGKVHEDEEETLKPYATLRYFPNGTRNCYNLNVTQETRYLIRAVFFYGNYDGQDSHPKFDLFIDRTLWVTVINPDAPRDNWASMHSQVKGVISYEEIIHTPKSNALKVCLVKTDTTTPFISALELRPLSKKVYATSNGSLVTITRGSLTDSYASVRYPDDVHDRIWFSYGHPNWTTINNTLNLDIYNPSELPQAVIVTATVPKYHNSPLIIDKLDYKSAEQISIYLHFLEVQVLRANDTRMFDIVVNGNTIARDYSPLVSMIETLYNTLPLNWNDSERSLELRKSSGSTLPPLINAIEIFKVLEFPKSATYENDFIAIENIRDAYALSNGSGDPCVPKPYHYLKCSNDKDTSETQRIISLNLSSTGLSGIISPTIQNLTKLQVLDLSRNRLTGGVPEFLSNMTSLWFIDLSNNSLSGPVPQALLDRRNEGLVLNFQGNQKLYEITSSKNKFPIAVVASVSSIAIVLIVLVVLFIGLRRKRSRRQVLQPSIETAKRRFSYSEVMKMTNNFQTILGEGGFGIIYHGQLDDIQKVAVKVLSQSSSQGYKQFKAEVELLMRVHHINLVNLAGYCDERDHLALVYEYMANRDLKEHLSGKEGSSFLDWPCRLRIAAETALGLEYLHTGCKPPMYHRDVKSTNILLNEDFQAKLGDFDLFLLEVKLMCLRLLLELLDSLILKIITNQLVIDQSRARPHIAEWVRFMLTTGNIKSVMDPNLKGDYGSDSAWKVLELAMSCSRPSSAERPNMAQIVHELNQCIMYEISRRGKSQDVSSKSSNEVNTSTAMAPIAR